MEHRKLCESDLTVQSLFWEGRALSVKTTNFVFNAIRIRDCIALLRAAPALDATSVNLVRPRRSPASSCTPAPRVARRLPPSNARNWPTCAACSFWLGWTSLFQSNTAAISPFSTAMASARPASKALSGSVAQTGTSGTSLADAADPVGWPVREGGTAVSAQATGGA
jgi:hypothetical protein